MDARREEVREARIFVQLAEAYFTEGLLDEAIQICRDGLVAHPGHAGGRALLARALLERGSLDEAEQEFRRLLEQVPTNVVALRFLSEISEKKGQVEEAERYSAQVLRLTPADPEIPERVTVLSVSQDASAVEQTGRARGGTRDPLASLTLAKLYASQGHPEVAEGIYSQIGRWRGVARPALSSRDISKEKPPASPVLEKLLALREAARKARGTVDRATRSNESYGH
jgi:predicted Zn-dependent protease